MGDPELRSDENILLRTPGVYVKSIPFEGILTNKRIILIDRATNLLPQKEIPLVTIKDMEGGENAIRDQIIKLSVLTRTGETRQMIFTFSRQTGGNRIRERDAWLKVLKENTSSTFEQVIRNVLPGQQPAPKRTERSGSPRIEVISSPKVQNVPGTGKTTGKKEHEGISPVKKIIEIRPVISSSLSEKTSEKKGIEDSSSSFGTYCSRCGNRVPEGSGYCNRCGSKIFVPGGVATTTIPLGVSETPEAKEPTKIELPEKDTGSIESPVEPSAERTSSKSLWAVQREPEVPTEEEPISEKNAESSVVHDEKFAETLENSDTERPIIIDSRPYESADPSGKLPGMQRPWDGFSFKPGKKAIIGIVAVIIILAVVLGGFFLYPMISQGSGVTKDNSTSHTITPTIVKNPGTPITPTKPIPLIPGKTTSPSAPGNRPANVGD